MAYSPSDVIDLTNSFTLANHCTIANAVIDLDTDDSFIGDESARSSQSTIDCDHHTLLTVPKVKKPTRRKSSINKNNNRAAVKEGNPEKLSSKFGDCPICWDELGKNKLASTKCGHVFCFQCLERCLLVEKRCPTCRKVLSGKSAYHPLYLSKS